MLAAMSQLNLAPTGGVTPANVGQYFAAGCRVVGVGANLVSKAVLERRDWDQLTRAARAYVDAIAAAKLTTAAGSAL